MLVLCTVSAHAFKLSYDEKRLMNHAYRAGNEFGMAEEVQAILLNESVAGRFGPIGDKAKPWKARAYGPMQVRFDTAKWILAKEVDLHYTDDDLKAALTYNNAFNMYVACLYIKYLKRYTKTWEQTVLAYNVGLGNVLKHDTRYDPNNYLAKAKDHMVNTIRDHNKKHFPTRVTRKIQKGDTLSKLAKQYYGDWRAWKKIKAMNPGIDEMKLKIGSVIVIME
jgi:nucleoid-associated protein YgaU